MWKDIILSSWESKQLKKLKKDNRCVLMIFIINELVPFNAHQTGGLGNAARNLMRDDHYHCAALFRNFATVLHNFDLVWFDGTTSSFFWSPPPLRNSRRSTVFARGCDPSQSCTNDTMAHNIASGSSRGSSSSSAAIWVRRTDNTSGIDGPLCMCPRWVALPQISIIKYYATFERFAVRSGDSNPKVPLGPANAPQPSPRGCAAGPGNAWRARRASELKQISTGARGETGKTSSGRDCPGERGTVLHHFIILTVCLRKRSGAGEIPISSPRTQPVF